MYRKRLAVQYNAEPVNNPPLLLEFAPPCFFGSEGEIYIVFDEESKSEVKNLEIRHPDLEIQENHAKF